VTVEEDWDHVAAHLNARMAELDLSQTRLADEAEVSQQLLRDLRKGVERSYRAAGLARIAVALGWPHDAFQRLRFGGPLEERRRLPHDVRTSLHLAGGQLLRRIEGIEHDLEDLRAEITRLLRVDDPEDGDPTGP
jgi:transcriptional regulator with XRE-family HTH domain